MHGGANRYLKSLAREPARRSIHLSSLLACLASSAVRPKSSIIENPLYQIHIQRTLVFRSSCVRIGRGPRALPVHRDARPRRTGAGAGSVE